MVEDEKILKDLGNKFKKARELASLKQTDVAEAAGLNASYYAQIERGEINLSVKKLQSIAKVLNIKSIDIT
jgi:transcriptional regulator with XRE-family HTH domain